MLALSVIIASHNRADLVAQALDSLVQQTVPQAEYEVIVVDNASTDHTAQVAKDKTDVIPGLRYIFEKRLGLSWARNAGMLAATGRYIAYLDDDATAEPQWIEALLAAFATQPAPACIGGRVELNWAGRPQSVPQRYWSLLTYLDYGTEDRPLTSKEYLVGANMAFERGALLRTGGFSTDLGRQGGKLLSGEEAQIVERIRQEGGLVYYASRATVWHLVQAERTRRSWLWRRIFWDGATQPVLDGAPRRTPSHCALQACRDMKRIVFFSLHCLAALARQDRQGGLDFALNATQRAGRLRTHLLLLFGSAS
jgi:glycosyltransferase involved in cell wall biosynthesis